MANKRADVLKLVRGLPATIHVKDAEARRVLDALKESIEWLVQNSIGTEGENVVVETPTGIQELEEGENVSIEKLAGGVRRIAVPNIGISDAEARAIAQDQGGGGIEAPEDPGGAVDTIGSAAEGSEAAEGTTKTFNDANGLDLYAFTRVGYFHAGDKILYGYVRKLVYDRYGVLYSVGAETRISIDVAVAES